MGEYKTDNWPPKTATCPKCGDEEALQINMLIVDEEEDAKRFGIKVGESICLDCAMDDFCKEEEQ